VPWRFLDAGSAELSARSASRRPKTCTEADLHEERFDGISAAFASMKFMLDSINAGARDCTSRTGFRGAMSSLNLDILEQAPLVTLQVIRWQIYNATSGGRTLPYPALAAFFGRGWGGTQPL
jgi:hypothetical protein